MLDLFRYMHLDYLEIFAKKSEITLDKEMKIHGLPGLSELFGVGMPDTVWGCIPKTVWGCPSRIFLAIRTRMLLWNNSVGAGGADVEIIPFPLTFLVRRVTSFLVL